MSKYTLETDFKSLKPKEAVKWMCEFPNIAEQAFEASGTDTRLLGHMLLLKAYINTISCGLKEHGRELSLLIFNGMSFLSDYIKGAAEPREFKEFACNVYACVLNNNTGEEITDSQEEFFEENFADEELTLDEWFILEWIGGLLLELCVISGEQLDFDFFSEFEDVENIDLFYNMESMLSNFAERCADIFEINDSSYEKVYQTELFKQVNLFVCRTLKRALIATKEQYEDLQKEYENKLMIPEEYIGNMLNI